MRFRVIFVVWLCLGAYAAEASQLDSLSCATYLLGMQKEHSIDSLSRAQTAAILRYRLAPFRKTLNPGNLVPSFEPLEVVSTSATEAQKQQVAARLAGIEDAFVNRGLDEAKENRNVVMATAVTGKREIGEFFNALADLRQDIDESSLREHQRIRDEARELIHTDPQAASALILSSTPTAFKNGVKRSRSNMLLLQLTAKIAAASLAVNAVAIHFISHATPLKVALFAGTALLGSAYASIRHVMNTRKMAPSNWLSSTHFIESEKLLEETPEPGYWAMHSANQQLPKEFIKFLLRGASIDQSETHKKDLLQSLIAHEGMKDFPLTAKALFYANSLKAKEGAQIRKSINVLFDTTPVFLDMISSVNDQGQPSLVVVLRTNYPDPQPDLPSPKFEVNKLLTEPTGI